MPIEVTLGEPLSRELGWRQRQVPLPAGPKRASLGLAELARLMGLELSGIEGRLLVIVNRQVVPPARLAEFALGDGDRVEILMMASGG